jgi:signal transduction histidine kinase/DNA-binding response OmpR family regulator
MKKAYLQQAVRAWKSLSRLDQMIRVGVDRVLPKNLTVRYILALVIVAALAVSRQLIIQNSLTRQTDDQRKIRLLERQVHDSENLRKAIQSLQLSSKESQIKIQVDLIESLANQFQKNGEILQTEGIHSRNETSNEPVSTTLHKVESSFQEITENFRLLTSVTDPEYDFRLSAITTDLLGKEFTYRTGLMELSKRYELSLETHLGDFKRIELILLFMTLFVLVIEAFYVFRPAVENLYDALRIRSEFLGRMGHEMRNPMNSILGMAHLLSETPLTEEQQKYLSILKQSSTSLLEVLNHLLDFSSIEAGSIRVDQVSFDLLRVLEQVIDSAVYSAHAHQIELKLDLQSEVPHLLVGDPVRLQQILMNLLGNAVKFTKEGKVTLRVTLRDQSHDKDSRDKNGERASIQFSVIDTGIGIERDKMDRIFDAFVQEDSSVRRRFGGTGLGLSISRELVHLLGGTLQVESQKNIGSTFFFTLPFSIAKEEVQTPALEIQIESPLKTRSLQILVVDDSKDNQFLVKAYLSTLPYQLHFADHGLDAVNLFRKTKFDLILMDLQMPEMDGYTATQIIRKRELVECLKLTPIVAVSAHDKIVGTAKFEKSQFSAYIVKPVNPEVLRRTILELTQTAEPEVLPAQTMTVQESELEKQLAELAPAYLANRKREFSEMKLNLQEKNFDRIKTLGHRIRGNAKSYGFPELGDFGTALEQSAENQNSEEIFGILEKAEIYLEKVTSQSLEIPKSISLR